MSVFWFAYLIAVGTDANILARLGPILSKAPLYNHINSAIDIFNVRCDIDKLIPSIKKILRIKYNLKIVKDNPMVLKKFY